MAGEWGWRECGRSGVAAKRGGDGEVYLCRGVSTERRRHGVGAKERSRDGAEGAERAGDGAEPTRHRGSARSSMLSLVQR